MGKREEVIEAMIAEAKKLNISISDDLISKVAVGLGPVLYNRDRATVACGQADELETVKTNFLKKKLALTNSDEELDAAIKEVCEQLGKSNRSKFRVHFYALLAMKFNKESIYA
jgi:malonyl CoA-acyl carrier protein transacylase